MNSKERAAEVLREAVRRAVKEWENSDRSDASQGGTWQQGTWATVQKEALSEWESVTVGSRRYLMAPAGETLACGTTGCLAGHMAVIDGWRFLITKPGADDFDYANWVKVLDIGNVYKNGQYEAIPYLAMSLLEPLGRAREVPCLDGAGEWPVSHDLFNGGNHISDVVKIADLMLVMNNLPPTGVSTIGMPSPTRSCSCMKVDG